MTETRGWHCRECEAPLPEPPSGTHRCGCGRFFVAKGRRWVANERRRTLPHHVVPAQGAAAWAVVICHECGMTDTLSARRSESGWLSPDDVTSRPCEGCGGRIEVVGLSQEPIEAVVVEQASLSFTEAHL